MDTTFNNHTEYGHVPQLSFGDFSFGVGDVQFLADGTMLVAGDFTHIDGQLRRGIALLDSTGQLLHTALNGEGALLTHDFNSAYMYTRSIRSGWHRTAASSWPGLSRALMMAPCAIPP